MAFQIKGHPYICFHYAHNVSLFLDDHSFEIKYQVFWKLREGSLSVVYYHPEVQSSSNNKEFSKKYYLEIEYIVTQSKFLGAPLFWNGTSEFSEFD